MLKARHQHQNVKNTDIPFTSVLQSNSQNMENFGSMIASAPRRVNILTWFLLIVLTNRELYTSTLVSKI